MVDEKKEGTIGVAAFNFKFPKFFYPFPQEEKDQVYLRFNKGDVLPEDIAEACERHTPDMIRHLTEKEIHELRRKDAKERGEKYKEVKVKKVKVKKVKVKKVKTLEDYDQKIVDELYDLKKKEQVERLKELGFTEKLAKEKQRVLKILELEDK